MKISYLASLLYLAIFSLAMPMASAEVLFDIPLLEPSGDGRGYETPRIEIGSIEYVLDIIPKPVGVAEAGSYVAGSALNTDIPNNSYFEINISSESESYGASLYFVDDLLVAKQQSNPMPFFNGASVLLLVSESTGKANLVSFNHDGAVEGPNPLGAQQQVDYAESMSIGFEISDMEAYVHFNNVRALVDDALVKDLKLGLALASNVAGGRVKAILDPSPVLPASVGNNVKTLSHYIAVVVVDTDEDGMSDIWEVANSLDPNLASDAALNPDNDGLTNLQEFTAGTDPNVRDTDADGIIDGTEITHGFDPLVADAEITETQDLLGGAFHENDLAISKDDKFIYGAYSNGASSGIYIWERLADNSLVQRHIEQVGNHLYTLELSPDGQWLYSSTPEGLMVYERNAETGYLTFSVTIEMPAGTGYIFDIEASSDGKDVYLSRHVNIFQYRWNNGQLELQQNITAPELMFAYTTPNSADLTFNADESELYYLSRNTRTIGSMLRDSVSGNLLEYTLAERGGVKADLREMTLSTDGADVYTSLYTELNYGWGVAARNAHIRKLGSDVELTTTGTAVASVSLKDASDYAALAVSPDGEWIYAKSIRNNILTAHRFSKTNQTGIVSTSLAMQGNDILPSHDGQLIYVPTATGLKVLSHPGDYQRDTDGDGIADSIDNDIDGDDIINTEDAFPYNPNESADADGDNIGDNRDGVDGDASEWRDYDGDGIGDNSDLDSDSDQLPDAWETEHGFDLYADDAALNPDNDGLTNLQEFTAGTDPNVRDTDADGIIDGTEITHGFDPLVADAEITETQDLLGGAFHENDLAISKDDKFIYGAYSNGASSGIYIWERLADNSLVQRHIEQVGNHLYTLELSPDGQWLYSSTPEGLMVYERNAETGYLTFSVTIEMPAGTGYIFDIEASSDGKDVYLSRHVNIFQYRWNNGQLELQQNITAPELMFAYTTPNSADLTFNADESELYYLSRNTRTIGSMLRDSVSGNLLEYTLAERGGVKADLREMTLSTDGADVYTSLYTELNYGWGVAARNAHIRKLGSDVELTTTGTAVASVSLKDASDYAALAVSPDGEWIYAKSIRNNILTAHRFSKTNQTGIVSTSLAMQGNDILPSHDGQLIYVPTATGLKVLSHPVDYARDRDSDGVSDAEDSFPDDCQRTTNSDEDSAADFIFNITSIDDLKTTCEYILDETSGEPTTSIEDVFPLDSTEWLDSDNDLLGNNTDDDDDNDQMPDSWEVANSLDSVFNDYDLDANPVVKTDTDNDGLINYDEYKLQTDPNVADSDGDGLSDSQEIAIGSNPNVKDSDNDGIEDLADAFPNDCNRNKDSDGDGWADFAHTGNDCPPLEANQIVEDAFVNNYREWLDTDGDGQGNNTDNDDDNDGYSDAWESQNGFDPVIENNKETDSDEDGISDWNEYLAGSNPNSAESGSTVQLESVNKTAFAGKLLKSWVALDCGLTYLETWPNGATIPGKSTYKESLARVDTVINGSQLADLSIRNGLDDYFGINVVNKTEGDTSTEEIQANIFKAVNGTLGDLAGYNLPALSLTKISRTDNNTHKQYEKYNVACIPNDWIGDFDDSIKDPNAPKVSTPKDYLLFALNEFGELAAEYRENKYDYSDVSDDLIQDMTQGLGEATNAISGLYALEGNKLLIDGLRARFASGSTNSGVTNKTQPEKFRASKDVLATAVYELLPSIKADVLNNKKYLSSYCDGSSGCAVKTPWYNNVSGRSVPNDYARYTDLMNKYGVSALTEAKNNYYKGNVPDIDNYPKDNFPGLEDLDLNNDGKKNAAGRDAAAAQAKAVGSQLFLSGLMMNSAFSGNEFEENNGNQLKRQVTDANQLFEDIKSGFNPLLLAGDFVPYQPVEHFLSLATELVNRSVEAEAKALSDGRLFDSNKTQLEGEILGQKQAYLDQIEALTGVDTSAFTTTINGETEVLGDHFSRQSFLAYVRSQNNLGGEIGTQNLLIQESLLSADIINRQIQEIPERVRIEEQRNKTSTRLIIQGSRKQAVLEAAYEIAQCCKLTMGSPFVASTTTNLGVAIAAAKRATSITLSGMQQADLDDNASSASIKNMLVDQARLALAFDQAVVTIERQEKIKSNLWSQLERTMANYGTALDNLHDSYLSDPQYQIEASRSEEYANDAFDSAMAAAYEAAKALEYQWSEKYNNPVLKLDGTLPVPLSIIHDPFDRAESVFGSQFAGGLTPSLKDFMSAMKAWDLRMRQLRYPEKQTATTRFSMRDDILGYGVYAPETAEMLFQNLISESRVEGENPDNKDLQFNFSMDIVTERLFPNLPNIKIESISVNLVSDASRSVRTSPRTDAPLVDLVMLDRAFVRTFFADYPNQDDILTYELQEGRTLDKSPFLASVSASVDGYASPLPIPNVQLANHSPAASIWVLRMRNNRFNNKDIALEYLSDIEVDITYSYGKPRSIQFPY